MKKAGETIYRPSYSVNVKMEEVECEVEK